MNDDSGVLARNSAPWAPPTDEIGFVPQKSDDNLEQIGFFSEKFAGAANEAARPRELSDVAAGELSALKNEMRPFLNESGSLAGENARLFAVLMKRTRLAQLDRLPKTADSARP